MMHRDNHGRFVSERTVLENLFEEVETWLSTAPVGYEYHCDDGRISTPRDAFRALDALRTYVLGGAA